VGETVSDSVTLTARSVNNPLSSDELIDQACLLAGLDDLGDIRFRDALDALVHSLNHGRPLDIANGCVFLASDEAAYINGVLLPIDGGYTAKLAIPDTSDLGALEPGTGAQEQS
jgi:NAD(P)-dependent dehydrogenase (short-subunit alcohol dehydrogenase family)